MRARREDLTTALRVDGRTGEKTLVEAKDVSADPGYKLHQYFCAACEAKGHRVPLNLMRAHPHKSVFESYDPESGEKLTDADGIPIVKNVVTPLSFRFNRKAGAPEHQCDNPIRFSALRQIGQRLNATQLGEDSFVFPVHVPGPAMSGESKRDIRHAERLKNMGFNRIETAADMQRLLSVLEGDRSLPLRQKFDDGKIVRRFDQFFYESAAKLHDDLRRDDVNSIFKSRLVAYVVDANVTPYAFRDDNNRRCLIDRSMPKLGDGNRLHLLVEAETWNVYRALKEQAIKNRNLLVIGEAYLKIDRPEVRIRVLKAEQFCPREAQTDILPRIDPRNAGQIPLL